MRMRQIFCNKRYLLSKRGSCRQPTWTRSSRQQQVIIKRSWIADFTDLGKPTEPRLLSTGFPGKEQLCRARESQVLP